MARLRNINALSDDAKLVAAMFFGFIGERETVTFHMVENEPTPRCAAGLDELVQKGVIAVAPADGGGLVYTVMMHCAAAANWLGRNPAVDFALTQRKG